MKKIDKMKIQQQNEMKIKNENEDATTKTFSGFLPNKVPSLGDFNFIK